MYNHGVYWEETATGIVAPVRVDVSLPVIIGTAPVHNLPEGTERPVNKPLLIFSMAEFTAQFGAPGEDETGFTLHEAASVYLSRYGVVPIVCINVFDPAKHAAPAQGETPAKPDVSKVTKADVIGGIDASTGSRTGLELVEEVFPRFGLVPGQLLAPGFSDDPAVAVVLGAKAANINGHFKATGLVDVPSSVAKYTDVPAWVKDNNLTDPALQIFFGSPVFGNAVEHGSVHLAATVASRDADNEGVPYWSPSNRRMLCNGLTHAGRELALTPSEAAYLNGQGIVTGLNFTGQMTVWGNRTAAYPAVTDVKDTFIPVRRMFNYIGNTLVLTAWQFTDSPLRRRFIEQICDSFNLWLNGLAAREYILGGKVAFLAGENPSTDLIDGTARFHVFIAPPPPAREIRFTLEYAPSYLTNLFAE